MLISTMGGSFLQQIMNLFVIIAKSTIKYETNFQENDSLCRLSTLFDGTSD